MKRLLLWFMGLQSPEIIGRNQAVRLMLAKSGGR